jgi:hypothetical protein
MTLDFEGLGVVIRCFVWSVLERSFIRRWWGGRGRSGGNISGEDISNLLLLGKVN